MDGMQPEQKIPVDVLSKFLQPTGKRPLGRPRRICEDNITIYIKEIGVNARNWVDSAQDRITGWPL